MAHSGRIVVPLKGVAKSFHVHRLSISNEYSRIVLQENRRSRVFLLQRSAQHSGEREGGSCCCCCCCVVT